MQFEAVARAQQAASTTNPNMQVISHPAQTLAFTQPGEIDWLGVRQRQAEEEKAMALMQYQQPSATSHPWAEAGDLVKANAIQFQPLFRYTLKIRFITSIPCSFDPRKLKPSLTPQK